MNTKLEPYRGCRTRWTGEYVSEGCDDCPHMLGIHHAKGNADGTRTCSVCEVLDELRRTKAEP